MRAQIKSAAESYPYESIDSFQNCGRINNSIRKAILQDVPGINRARLAKGIVRDDAGRTAPHMFVVIPGAELDASEPLIVDAALDQFTDENQHRGAVQDRASFGSKDEFGPTGTYDQLTITTPSQSPFNHAWTEFVE